jgi:hypothetical protein
LHIAADTERSTTMFGPNAQFARDIDIEEDEDSKALREAGGSLQGFKGRYTVNGDDIHQDSLGHRAANASTPVDPSKGILASARTKNGAIPSDLNDDSICTLAGGMTATLGSLVKAGLIQKINGKYVEPKADAEEVIQDQQQQGEAPLMLEPQVEASIQAVYDEFGERTAEQVLSNIIFGSDEQASLNKAASILGRDPGEFTAEANNVIDHFNKLSSYYIKTRCKADGDAVLAWGREEVHPSDLKQLAYMIYRGDMSGLKVLTREYNRAMAEAQNRE